MTAYHLEHAWLGDRVAPDIHVRIEDGRFTAVGPRPLPGAERLPGLTIPGLANCHSHAFHRALRGRAQTGRGTFWDWREEMYAVARRLDPDSYRELATAVFAEMAAAGITSVGEFHYVHHRPDGSAHREEQGGPNAMGLALIQAARAAGVRLTLLDTCYLAAGLSPSGPEPLTSEQRRFSDGSGEEWLRRVDQLLHLAADDVVVGAAVHSVRAVPLADMRVVADWADRFETPLHVHLSEQVDENQQCQAAYGRTPTEVLEEAGVLTDRATVVHATHLTDSDVDRIGAAAAYSCFCPTTERDLGDGVGPSRALREAGSRLTLGSDSHAVVDLFEEMRAIELDERLVSRTRGHWSAAELLHAATVDGAASLGYADAGRIAVGQRADLVTLNLSSPRTAGCGPTPETVVYAASAADVVQVVAGGRMVHRGPQDKAQDDARVGAALAAAVERVTGEGR